MEDIQLPCAKTVRMTLIDTDPVASGDQTVKLFVTPLGIQLFADGYGDFGSAEGYGAPVFITQQRGELVLYVFADINKEDPTHRIKLGGARENKRLADTR